MKILSPCGSLDSVYSAVKFGADAIYLGLSDFSARKNAENFTKEQLLKAVSYCHERGVEVFVAINTLIYESEIKDAIKTVRTACDYGADGIIVQDMGVYEIIKRVAPKIRLVGSTQMTVNNVYGVRMLEEIGFDTVVLPRELSKAQIKEITDRTNIKTEIFCHGALCVCYSGQCYFSSFIGARSGNRGLCAQPCRMVYEYKSKKGYLISPKDLSLLKNLGEVEETGADILKIEGRLKSKYYTASVTDVYRRVLDSGELPTDEDISILNASFMRGGYTPAYFKGIKDHKLFNFKKRENPYSDDTKKLEKHYDNLLRQTGDFYKSPINLHISFENDFAIKIAYEYLDLENEFVSEVNWQKAEKLPLSEDKLTSQLQKTGNEPFYFENIDIDFKENDVFLPVSQINEIRREISRDISKMLEIKPSSQGFSYKTSQRSECGDLSYIVTVRNPFQLKWVREKWNDVLIFAKRKTLFEYEKKYGELTNVGLWCERIPDEQSLNEDKRFLNSHPNITKVMAGTLGAVKKFNDRYEIYSDFTLNITNTLSSEFYREKNVENQTLSVELNLKNIKAMGNAKANLCVLAYGSIPLMVTESCLKSNIRNGCNKDDIVITDRKNEEFIITCEDCSKNAIYNSYPLMMADKLSDIKRAGIDTIRLDFVFENKAQTEEILLSFKTETNPLTKFTRGHFYRGAI